MSSPGFRALTPAIGAFIEVPSLAALQDVGTLGDVVRDRGVVIIRAPLPLAGAAELTALAGALGMPIADPHPSNRPRGPGGLVTCLRNGPDFPPQLDHWHSDGSFLPAPPRFTVLQCRSIPASGGDTIWLNTALAWARLPAEQRALCRKLTAEHTITDTMRALTRARAAPEESWSCIHPLVIAQAGTGRPCLYANRLYTRRLHGTDARQARRLLVRLLRWLENPAWQYRHRWRRGDIAVWDNHSTQHYAVADYFPQVREMWRFSIAGSALAAAAI